MKEIDERYRISKEELNTFFKGKRIISIQEYYNFLEWREQNKVRV